MARGLLQCRIEKSPRQIWTGSASEVFVLPMRIRPHRVHAEALRACLTGRYCWRSRLKAQVLTPWGTTLDRGRPAHPAGVASPARVFNCCIGKWHLVGLATKDGSRRQRPGSAEQFGISPRHPQRPNHRGFDSYFGVDLPNYSAYIYIENDHTIGIPACRIGRSESAPAACCRMELVISCRLRRGSAVRTIEDAAKTQPPKPFIPVLPVTFAALSGRRRSGVFRGRAGGRLRRLRSAE